MLKSQHELRLKHYSYQCMSYLVPLCEDCDSELCLCAGGLCLFKGVPSSSLHFCLFVWGFLLLILEKNIFSTDNTVFIPLYGVFSALYFLCLLSDEQEHIELKKRETKWSTDFCASIDPIPALVLMHVYWQHRAVEMFFSSKALFRVEGKLMGTAYRDLLSENLSQCWPQTGLKVHIPRWQWP